MAHIQLDLAHSYRPNPQQDSDYALLPLKMDFEDGGAYALLGPSGCGKTTLMRSIVGTQIITKGTVTVLGKPGGSADLRRRVGYVTQEPTVYNDLRVIDNVRYFAALTGVRAVIEERPLAQAAEAFERMNSGQARYRMVLTV